ncbi:MAG TPA: SdpI family protein, partial [Clostridia bacterium]|nr:SdpI family protein [Clostridia bacterium]
MKGTTIKIHWALWVIMLGTLVFGLVIYPQLPEQVPIHWNAAGEVDGYGSRFMGALGLPLMNLGLALLLKFVPAIDPKRQNYEKFKPFYQIFIWIFVLFMTGLYFLTIAWALGYRPSIALFTKLGMGIMFMVLGNYLGKVRPNWFFGIRTPWTIENEEVWLRTHRLGGPLMFGAGLITVFLA